MTAVARAWLGAGIVLVVPGCLIASCLGMRLRSITTWAAVPGFSLAAVFVVGEAMDVTGVPFGVPAFAVLIVLLGVASLTRHQRRRGCRDVPTSPARHTERAAIQRDRSAVEARAAYGLLLLGIAGGALTWARGITGFSLGPASNDGSHHAFFVARILAANTVDVSKVVVSDPVGLVKAGDYYPLGMHASAAIAVRLGGADIGRVLIAFLVIFGAIVLPLGMFALARMLAPRQPLVAGFTALIVPSLVMFPYYPSVWGGLSLIVGMGMVPVSVVLVTRAVTDTEMPLELSRRFVIRLVPAALLLLAAISVHSTELVLIGFFVTLLVLEQVWLRQSLRVLRDALVRGVVALLLMALLFAPTLMRLGPGVSERSESQRTPITSIDAAIGPVLTLRAGTLPRQGALAALALLGACIWLMRRRPGWVLAGVGVIALTLLASTSQGTISRALTLPWRRQPDRIAFNQAFFVPFFAAIVSAVAVSGIARLLRSRRWVVPASVAVVALFVGLVGLHAHRITRAQLQGAYEAYRGLKPASQRAYGYLQQHARPDDSVVHDPEVDGSLWMYPEAGLNPLLGLPPAARDWTPEYRERIVLRDRIADVGRDPQIDELVRRYEARWIYLDEHTFPAGTHVLDLSALRENPRITEVFRRGNVHVFKIDIGGRRPN